MQFCSVSVLLSAHAKIFSVSCMWDFSSFFPKTDRSLQLADDGVFRFRGRCVFTEVQWTHWGSAYTLSFSLLTCGSFLFSLPTLITEESPEWLNVREIQKAGRRNKGCFFHDGKMCVLSQFFSLNRQTAFVLFLGMPHLATLIRYKSHARETTILRMPEYHISKLAEQKKET